MLVYPALNAIVFKHKLSTFRSLSDFLPKAQIASIQAE